MLWWLQEELELKLKERLPGIVLLVLFEVSGFFEREFYLLNQFLGLLLVLLILGRKGDLKHVGLNKEQ